MPETGQPSLLKRYNSDLVETIIFERGPITKPEIAQITSLSLPTVNKLVEELENSGTIRIDKTSQGSGVGRRAKYYVANEKLGSIITINYLDGKWYCALVDFVGNVKEETSIPVVSGNLEQSLAPIFKLVDEYAGKAGNLLSIGLGIPGVVLGNGAVTSIPTIPAWEGLQLQHLLEQRYSVPVLIENDVKLMTLGYYATNLPNVDNMIFFYFGAGIGAGIVINKKLYKGSTSFAGEFGFMASCPAEQDLQDRYPESGLTEKAITVLLQKLQENPGDLSVRKDYYYQILRVVVNSISVVNPEVVILHGDCLEKDALPYFEHQLTKYLPQIHLPELRITEKDNYGMNGLIHSCLTGLTKRCRVFDSEEQV